VQKRFLLVDGPVLYHLSEFFNRVFYEILFERFGVDDDVPEKVANFGLEYCILAISPEITKTIELSQTQLVGNL